MSGSSTATTEHVVARTRPRPTGALAGRAPIAVIGVGEALAGDGAFGPSTLCLLEHAWRWPPEVELVAVAAGGMELAALLRAREHVILLDAVRADAAPGTVVSWQREALLSAGDGARPAPHEPGITTALAMAEVTGSLPREVMLIGVVPVATAAGTELSPVVQVSCRIAAIEVVRRVRDWGARVEAIPTPDRRPWWKPVPAQQE